MDDTVSKQRLDKKHVNSVSRKKRDDLRDLGVVGNIISGSLAQQFRTWRCEPQFRREIEVVLRRYAPRQKTASGIKKKTVV
jgi:hypothetical protein